MVAIAQLERFTARSRLYLDGKWVAADVLPPIAIENPATELPFGTVPTAHPGQITAAVQAAGQAMTTWSRCPPKARARLLRQIADALEQRTEMLSALLIQEVGVPRRQVQPMQIHMAVDAFRSAAVICEEHAWEGRIAHSQVLRAPLGPVACIVPWNVPLYQSALKVASALAAGNTVILKPSELAPLATFMLADAIDEVELPPGTFNLLCGDGRTGAALAGHPGLGKISFTGSTATGQAILRGAAQTITPVSLELGGKGAALVLDAESMLPGIVATVRSCFALSGQTCAATTRLIVPTQHLAHAVEILTEEIARYLVGDPSSEETMVGPLISAPQKARVDDLVTQAVGRGATPLTHSQQLPDRGHYVAPVVLTGIDPLDVIAQEEIFGPVLCLLGADSAAEAVEIANGTPYGLSHAVWASDGELAGQIARQLDAGSIYVNGGSFNPQAPFGGTKCSGYGRERGKAGVDEFTQAKSLHWG